jgi:peptide/nickel transport system ATP-binding protein
LSASANPAVEVSGLSITVGLPDGSRRAIVDDVSFAIPKGEVLALIGESGSGKTTIALAMMGYSRFGGRIAADCIRIGGTRIEQLDQAGLRSLRGSRVAYIAQSAAAAFNPSRTIMAQVIEPLIVHGLASPEAARAKAIGLFRELALPAPETIGERYPHQVSGGQLQRLMAAMALITDPELVILDEPTTALDVTTQVEVLNLFKSALAKSGATAIYVSHDLAVVAQMADRIVVLKDGRIAEQGEASAVLHQPKSDYARTLMAATRPVERAAGPADPGTVLSVADLYAGYGRVRGGRAAMPVLVDVSFALAKGSSLGVIGESGSGKSTLARVIAGLLPASSGTIRLAGDTLAPDLASRTKEQLRRVQIVFQNADTALNPAQSVHDTLARPLAFYHGVTGTAAQERVARLLETIQLDPALAERRTAELSGGQKQRINLARALAADPDVILCDEVTSALDTVVGAAILELIDGLRRDLGIATVFISHDISTVRAFCDDMLVLYAGQAVESCSKAAFSGTLHHPYTRLLIASVPELDRSWLASRAGQHQAAMAEAAVTGDLCRFLPRCPIAMPGTCDRLPPPTAEMAGQRVLCHAALHNPNIQEAQLP